MAALAVLTLSAVHGCGWLPREPVVPMPAVADAGRCARSADTLLVLLPGRGMTTDELQREGFVDAVREAGLAVDVVRTDAHLGYYKARTVVDRLHDDVIAPARARGYRHVWLAGISLGGLGALLVADARPTDVDGVLLLAPYLGEAGTLSAIGAAGGLRNWRAPPALPGDDALDGRLWRNLQARTNDPASMPILLGYGLQDRLAAGHTLLGAALPAERVFTEAGGHDWNPWLGLWRRMLAKAPLPRCTG